MSAPAALRSLRGCFILAAAIALTACSGSTAKTSATPRSSAATTTSTSPPTSTPTGDVGATARQSFIGHWTVHGSQLEIKSNTVGVRTSNCSPPCVETDDLSLSLSPDGRRMTVTIAKITYTDETTGKPMANPDPDGSNGVGDSYYLQFVAPHLMKRTIIHTSLPRIEWSGNPYWCGKGLAASLEHFCGA